MSINCTIVPCRSAHIPGILEVCYRTGNSGEDLTGTGFFNDRYLFGLRYCLFYARYETEHCFVAIDDGGRVVGYILGALDTALQKQRMRRKMGWRIRARALLLSSWRYPESFRCSGALLRSLGSIHIEPELLVEYPAHLHINVLPEYQRGGAGGRLLERLEAHLREAGVSGLHLGTTSANIKAVPFYLKLWVPHPFREAKIILDVKAIEKLVFIKSLD